MFFFNYNVGYWFNSNLTSLPMNQWEKTCWFKYCFRSGNFSSKHTHRSGLKTYVRCRHFILMHGTPSSWYFDALRFKLFWHRRKTKRNIRMKDTEQWRKDLNANEKEIRASDFCRYSKRHNKNTYNRIHILVLSFKLWRTARLIRI